MTKQTILFGLLLAFTWHCSTKDAAGQADRPAFATSTTPDPPQRTAAQDLARRLVEPNALGAVLLKNDRVILGDVRLDGQFYVIRIADRSSVSIPTHQVELVGRDLQALYQHKVESNRYWRSGDHIQLAHWCLQNDLLEQAVEHYSKVAKFHSESRSVRSLSMELRKKMLQDSGFRAFLGLPPEPHSKVAETNKQSESLTEIDTTQVVTASATATAAGNSLSLSTLQHPYIARDFYDRVEPILINRCSQAACHGVYSSNDWMLLDATGRSTARISRKNLKATLKFVGDDNSQIAPLLHWATTPHGKQTQAAILASETRLISVLREWIRFVRNPVTDAAAHQTLNNGMQPGQNTTAVHRESTRTSNSLTPNQLVPLSPNARPLRAVPSQASGRFTATPNNTTSHAAQLKGNRQNTNGTSPDPSSRTTLGSVDESPAALGVRFPTQLEAPSIAEIDALEQQLDRMQNLSSPKNIPLDRSSLQQSTSTRTMQATHRSLPGHRVAEPQNKPVQDPFDPEAFNRSIHREDRDSIR